MLFVSILQRVNLFRSVFPEIILFGNDTKRVQQEVYVVTLKILTMVPMAKEKVPHIPVHILSSALLLKGAFVWR